MTPFQKHVRDRRIKKKIRAWIDKTAAHFTKKFYETYILNPPIR